jgi:hypothetical protein
LTCVKKSLVLQPCKYRDWFQMKNALPLSVDQLNDIDQILQRSYFEKVWTVARDRNQQS